MKKTLITVLCAICLIAGCTAPSAKDDPKPNPSASQPKQEAQSKGRFFIEDTPENLISVQMPQSEDIGEEEIAYIANYIQSKLEAFTDEKFSLTRSENDVSDKERDYTQYAIEVTSRISYMSEEKVSIIFDGFFNHKEAAHPTDLLWTLNYDPQTMKEIKFSECFIIDEALYNAFSDEAKKNIMEHSDGKWPDGWASFSEQICSKESFLEGMEADGEKGFYFYFTENGVGISYPVPFALGNHLEVELPATVLKAKYSQVPLEYREILSDYEKLVAFRLSPTFEKDYNSGKDIKLSETLAQDLAADKAEDSEGIDYRWGNMLVEMPSGLAQPTARSFGYILKDINGDGAQELFWVRQDGFVLAVFTIYGQKAHIVDAHWPRYKAIVTDEGELYTQSSGGAADTVFEIKKLGANNGELTLVKQFGTEGVEGPTGMVYYEVNDGKKITVDEARFDQLLSLYPFEEGDSWIELPINPLE